MLAKVFAALNIALVLFLLGFGMNGPQNVASYYVLGALASAAVAFGCWKRRRWLACLGAVPVLIAAAASMIIVGGYPGVFNRQEAGMINSVIFGISVFEIASIAAAGKPSSPDLPPTQ
jgi:hypothetical protein